MTKSKNNQLQTATFGAGCFWETEEIFRHLKGVKSTAVGFMGGSLPNPTYEDVCTGKTGHAEVAQIKYDPAEISYEKLLDVFWNTHDPTTLNQQGPDLGPQYRSVIFFHTPEQERLAKKSREAVEKSGKYKNSIVTELAPASTFYKADESHQQYLDKRNLTTCHL